MITDLGKLDQKIRAALAPCSLGSWPTPLESVPALAAVAGVDALWLKREDLAGGSKVRGLEFLLADAAPGTVFVTLGATGSTHCLATAVQADRVGRRAVVAQFPQVATDLAARVAAACRARAAAVVQSRSMLGFPFALLKAWRIAGQLGPRRWIPAGGAAPRAVIGHFLGGLELAQQVSVPPDAIVAPLGSCGTVAGLSLAVAVLEWPTRVVGVRVVTRFVANRGRTMQLARGAQRELAPVALVPSATPPLIVDGVGSGYGHPTPAGEEARGRASGHGLTLDPTYGAKTFAMLPALAERGFRRVIFWHTFAAPPAVEPAL